ncbi:MAG: hypothetical protein GOV00_03765 [Candidatus Altiarchaeota archaeon]|nr:hypothetical protein [Candidatus Altiarchaeota archaeon]
MDVAVIGFGPAALYVSGKLAAEGYDVTLLGKPFTLLPEFVTAETVNEFQINDYILEKINRIAIFSEDFRLTEKNIKGAIIDSQSLVNDMILTASRYGADILADSKVSISDPRKDLQIRWMNKTMQANADIIVMETSEGAPVPVVEVSRVPVNNDTVEFYEKSKMWVLPAGRTVFVEGSTDMSWHKFVNAAILRTSTLYLPPKRALIEGKLIRVGRAAGQVSGPGWVVESGLYAGKILFECLLKYLEGDEDALKVYEKLPQKDGLARFMGPKNI